MAQPNLPALTLAVAAKGCCPVCLDIAPPADEDGWQDCLDCSIRFKSDGVDFNGMAILHVAQREEVYSRCKAALVVGIRRVEGLSAGAPPA
jgi:hypothetical protein